MVDTSTRYAWDQRLEDQFFVRHLPLLGYRVAPARVAQHFSAESAFPVGGGLRPAGVHKPHAHLDGAALRELLGVCPEAALLGNETARFAARSNMKWASRGPPRKY